MHVRETDDYESGVQVRWYAGVQGGNTAREVVEAVERVLGAVEGDLVILAEADEPVLRRMRGQVETFPCEWFPSLDRLAASMA